MEDIRKPGSRDLCLVRSRPSSIQDTEQAGRESATFSDMHTFTRISVALLAWTALGCEPPAQVIDIDSAQDARLVKLEAETSKNGRYTIINGTPDLARNIVLLDTRTGRTWLMCKGRPDDIALVDTKWCALEYVGATTVP